MKKEGKKSLNRGLTLIISIIVVAIVAFIGSLFTRAGTSSQWYQDIKPAITPPDYVFPIAWGILFFLIALSLFFALIKNKHKFQIIFAFFINFIFNILWSFFFFYLRMPVLGFADIILVWLSIFNMMVVVKKVSKISFLLLIPYLLWVTFAMILNLLAII